MPQTLIHLLQYLLSMEYIWFVMPNGCLYTLPCLPIPSTEKPNQPSAPDTVETSRTTSHSPSSTGSVQLEQPLVLTRQDLICSSHPSTMKMWTQEEDRLLLLFRDQQHLEWDEIAQRIEGRNPKMCYNRYKRLLFATKAPWRSKDDQKLLHLVSEMGEDWELIGQHLKKWHPREIQERYANHLRPDLCHDEWTVEEDWRLVKYLNEYGKDWKNVESHFPGRSLNQIKNRFKGKLNKLNQKKLQGSLPTPGKCS